MMYIFAIDPLPGNSKKVVLRIDGGEDIYLYKGDLRKFNLSIDSDISSDTYDRLIAELLIPRARKRVLHLLERQDYTLSRLRQKLTASHYPDEVCDDAIAYAESYHYVDDERYARNYIIYHKDNSTRRRLYQKLIERGIDSSLVESVLEEEYDTDEYALAASLLAKRGYDSATADRAERNKMYRFLMSRGFDSSVVSSSL